MISENQVWWYSTAQRGAAFVQRCRFPFRQCTGRRSGYPDESKDPHRQLSVQTYVDTKPAQANKDSQYDENSTGIETEQQEEE